jgi:hypothetical protein
MAKRRETTTLRPRRYWRRVVMYDVMVVVVVMVRARSSVHAGLYDMNVVVVTWWSMVPRRRMRLLLCLD